jgi:hypothetical protein
VQLPARHERLDLPLLAGAGVVSPVVMNFRAGDRSALLARFRELVGSRD